MSLSPPVIIPIVALVANLLIGFYVHERNPWSQTGRSFLLMIVVFASWQACAAVQRASVEENALIWNKLQYGAVALILPSFTYFVQCFVKGTRTLLDHRWLRYSFHGLGGLLAVLSMTDLIISDRLASTNYVFLGGSTKVYYGEFGPLYLLFAAIFVVVLLMNVIALVQSYVREPSLNRKKGILCVFAGFFVLAVVGSITDALLPLAGIRMPTAEILSAVNSAIFAVAIVRYRIFSISPSIFRSKETVRAKGDWGHFIAVDVQEGREHIDIFNDLLDRGGHGSIFTGKRPEEVRSKIRDKDVPIVWVTDEDTSRKHINPTQVQEIGESLSLLFSKGEKQLILLDTPKIYAMSTFSSYDRFWEMMDLMKGLRRTLKNTRSTIVVSIEGYEEVPQREQVQRVDDIWWFMPTLIEKIPQFAILDPVNEGLEREEREAFSGTFGNISRHEYGVEWKGDEIGLTGGSPRRRDEIIRLFRIVHSTLKVIGRTDLQKELLEHARRLEITDPEILLHPGGSYLVLEEDARRAYGHLRSLSRYHPALCIMKGNPERVRRKYGLHGECKIIWLTKEREPTEDARVSVLRPELEYVYRSVKDYLETHNDGVILMDDYEFLRTTFGKDALFRYLERVIDAVATSDGIILLPINPEIMDVKEMALLRRFLEEG